MNRTVDIYRLRFWIAVIIQFAIGLAVLYGSEYINDESIWNGVAENIGTAFFFTGILGLVQEFLLKEKLVDVILSKLKLREDINKTGIESIFFGIKEIDYGFHFKKASRNIDIIHIYGRTWTNTNIDDIEDRLLHSNCKIRVVLLSPDSPFVPALATHYNQTPESLETTIRDVAKLWKLAYEKKEQVRKRKTQSIIELYYHTGFPANCLYRIDDRIIFVQNKMTKGKSKRLPSFIYQKTEKAESLYNDQLNEIESLISESEKVDWNQV